MSIDSLALAHHQNDTPVSSPPHTALPTTGIATLTAETPTHQTDRYTVMVPALLPRVRCFVDVSTQPDQPSNHIRPAGIRILIVNTQVQSVQTVYIKAAMTATHSVITAEAAAMALAAIILDRLGFSDVSYLSDCSQLVQFLNEQDRNNPPDWRILEFTQVFDNYASNQQAKIYRIARTINNTVDSLARIALSATTHESHCTEFACSYTSHQHQCPLRNALNSVTLRTVTVLAASCC